MERALAATGIGESAAASERTRANLVAYARAQCALRSLTSEPVEKFEKLARCLTDGALDSLCKHFMLFNNCI